MHEYLKVLTHKAQFRQDLNIQKTHYKRTMNSIRGKQTKRSTEISFESCGKQRKDGENQKQQHAYSNPL